jgi:hypothetical protein
VKKYLDNDNKLICVIHHENEWVKGLDFLTNDKEFIQVGTWWYDKGKILDRHYHNEIERISTLTCECVFVVQGSILVSLYDDDKNFLGDFVLASGDTGIFLGGGHGYEILEDSTKILETKNGPFFGVELDKTRF